jgi:LPS-assembly lipoprotein
MWFFRYRAVFCAAFLLAVAACGFQPLYQKNSAGGAISDDLARVKIANIKTKTREDDRLAQKFHDLLLDRLNPNGRPQKPGYTLNITMGVGKEETGIQITDDATRARLTVSASFALRDIATNKDVLTGSERSVNSYNIVDSEFATLSAEADASGRAIRELSDSIKLRIGVYFTRLRQQEPTREDRRR